MTNHFRTLLLNLSYAGTPDEHIPTGFAARTLSGKPLEFYNILFPPGSSRTKILQLGQAYLELIEAARLTSVITLQDSRVTYDLKHDFKNFKQPSFNINSIIGKLTGDASIPEGVLRLPKQVDVEDYDNMWNQHPNKAYRLAGLIAAYVIRLA